MQRIIPWPNPLFSLFSKRSVRALHEQSLLCPPLYTGPLVWKSPSHPATTTPDVQGFSLAPCSTGAMRQWKKKRDCAQHGAPETKNNQLSTLPKHCTPLTPLASHCCTSSLSAGSWLGTVAGVALEIKIAPLVAELGCHPGGRQAPVDMAAVVRDL